MEKLSGPEMALVGTMMAAAILDEIEALHPGARKRVMDRVRLNSKEIEAGGALGRRLAAFIEAMPQS